MNSAYDFIIWIYTHTGNFDTVIFALPVIILISLIYWFARLIRQKHKFGDECKTIRRKARLNEIIRLLTVCWFTALLCLTLTPTEFWMKVWISFISNRNPFEHFLPGHFGEIVFMPTILQFIIEGNQDWIWWSAGTIFTHLILNVLLFVPAGFAMPFIYRNANLLHSLLAGFSLSLLIEFIQFFLGRECEMDDLICNTLGAVAGYLLYLCIRKLFPDFTEKCRNSSDQIFQEENL